MTLNQEFKIVFQPHKPEHYNGRRRFAIGAGQMHRYLGEDNVQKTIDMLFSSTDQNFERSLRAHGKIKFYRK